MVWVEPLSFLHPNWTVGCSMMDTAETTDSEYFYEKEAEYYGFTPFQFLDEIGEIVVKAVFGMFDETPRHLAQNASFLTKGQIEAVRRERERLMSSYCF